MEESKSKLTAGLLGIFLGAYGVHNFYLGYTKKAVIQVSVTGASIVLSFILGITLVGLVLVFIPILASMGMGIWGLVEGIMILAGKIDVDGHGIPLKD